MEMLLNKTFFWFKQKCAPSVIAERKAVIGENLFLNCNFSECLGVHLVLSTFGEPF